MAPSVSLLLLVAVLGPSLTLGWSEPPPSWESCVCLKYLPRGAGLRAGGYGRGGYGGYGMRRNLMDSESESEPESVGSGNRVPFEWPRGAGLRGAGLRAGYGGYGMRRDLMDSESESEPEFVGSGNRSPASMGERGGWNLSYGGYGMRAGYGGYGMRRDADWLEARQCFCPRSQGARGAGYRVA